MLYAWENPRRASARRSPETFLEPKYTFTALVPARNEEAVISDTIRAIDRIDYPEQLKEAIILCREDDTATIKRVEQELARIGKHNIRLMVFGGYPVNKPKSLNIGLSQSQGDFVAIFDAEDEPHSDIYSIVNTVALKNNSDVVQSGVQLVNYKTKWFSALNCLEYFFWFKSGLLFFSEIFKAAPLGGNTVFFKRELLQSVNGWDVNCLTEDADVGVRLSRLGAKISVVYDEEHSTREETPHNIGAFVKQRTRWNQGFIQVFLKGEWLKMPGFWQKIIIAYILLSPVVQGILLLYLPVAIYLAVTSKISVVVSMVSFIPLAMLALQFLINLVGFREFLKMYHFKFSPIRILLLFVTFIPYQMVLLFSALRAVWRLTFQVNSWEKTLHFNNHRAV